MLPVADVPPAVPLRKNRDFRRLWLSQTISMIGARSSELAYPLLVIGLTGSAAAGGLVASVAAATRLILRLPGGAIADRIDRRRLMLWCESVRAAAMSALVISVVFDLASIAVIAGIVAVDAAAGTFFAPAERAALRHVVDRGQLPAAAAQNEARAFAGDLIGPALGGFLFGFVRWLPFAADALSYLVSMYMIRSISRPLQEGRETPRDRRRSIGRDISEGFRFVLSEPFLRAAAGLVTLLNLSYTGVMFVLIATLAKRGAAPLLVGAASGAIAASGLVGAFLAPLVQRRLGPRPLLVTLFWTMAVLTGAAALVPTGFASVAPLALAMLLLPATNGTLSAYQIGVTPDHLQARVTSVLIFIAAALTPLAPVAGGALVDGAGTPAAFAVFATLMVLAALLTTMSTGIRGLRATGALLSGPG
jgi:hypothetical protein